MPAWKERTQSLAVDGERDAIIDEVAYVASLGRTSSCGLDIEGCASCLRVRLGHVHRVGWVQAAVNVRM